MSSTKETAMNTTLEEVEQEIRQIDQIMHSWSDGRVLRFDPPHVRPPHVHPTVEPPGKNPQEQVQDLRDSCRLVFQVNLAVLVGIIALAVGQGTVGLVSNWWFSLVLAAAVVLVTGFNLLQATYSRGLTGKLLNPESRAQKSPAKPNSLRSNV